MRMLKQLFAGMILFTLAATASATLVEVRMSGYVPIDPFSSTGTVPSLGAGSLVSTSFVLDTGSVGAADMLFGTFSGPGFPAGPVLESFHITDVLTQNIALFIDGVNAGPAPGTVGRARYDGALSSPPNGTDYDLFMAVSTPGFFFSFQDFNALPAGAISEEDLLGSDDPLASLLSSYGTNPAFAFLQGGFGSVAFAVDSLQIRGVPEPATIGLLALGGALLLLMGKRRRRSQSIASAS